MSEWHWETATESALFPPNVPNFIDGWREWFGVLRDDTPAVAEIFSREFIQNFADAADELLAEEEVDSTPSMLFRFVRLTGSAAADVRAKLGLEGHVDRFNGMTAAERDDHRLSDSAILAETNGELNLLVAIEKFATGMYGPWEADGRARDANGNRIRRKMRDALIKPSGEKSSATSLGSYGEGKRGVALASKIRTLVAYSCFRAQPYDPGVNKRLLGVSYWRKHIKNDWEYTGLALFGKRGQDGETERAVPFENSEADAVVSSLGIEGLNVRDHETLGDLGTSWIIVEPAFNARELRDAVARNWWPRMEAMALHVSIIDSDQTEYRVSGRELEPLRPFIDAYQIAAGLTTPRDHLDRLAPLSVIDADIGSLGSLGLTVDLAEDGWSWDDADNNAHMVAMIRGGMVVQYETFPRQRPTSIPPFVRGAFIVGDEAAQRKLRNAEPPLHNLWVEDDRRGYPKESVSLAKRTYSKINEETKAFAQRFREEPPPREHTFDTFARFFRTSDDAHVMPPPDPIERSGVDPWTILVPSAERLDPRLGDPTQIRVIAQRTLALKNDWKDDELEVRVRIGWEVVEDNDEGAWAPELIDVDEDAAPAGFTRDGEYYIGRLTKTSVEFTWTSRFYSSDWITKASLLVEAVAVGGDDDA